VFRLSAAFRRRGGAQHLLFLPRDRQSSRLCLQPLRTLKVERGEWRSEHSESEKASQKTPRKCFPTPVAVLLLSGRDQPSSWGPVDSPPWNRQRRFPGTTLMMHGAPALVLAQHLGRNLRFKGSPLCDRPRSNILRHQCRSRHAPSEHARPVLGQRTMEFTS
jgi:hypothetical protein